MKRIAVYPGTFDPLTWGHLDIIEASAVIFDEVIVGLLKNLQKKPMFTEEERLAMVDEAVKAIGLTNIRVKCFSGLTVKLVRQENAIAIIRGLRLTTEYEDELSLSFNNRILDSGIITILIPPRQEHIHISSSAVRDFMNFGERDVLYKYVPPTIFKHITQKK